MLLSRLIRLAVQRVAYNPQARTAALKAAKQVATEAKLIARDKDKARAAGRSVRRALGKLQGERDGS